MEEAFTKIVQHIFNNWSALKLAVDHSMGGPNSKQIAMDCMNYMVQYCLYEDNIDHFKIQEALEDLMDEEFNTLCEDGSIPEISAVLHKFVQLMKEGNSQQCQEEFQKLPTMNPNWMNNTIQQNIKESSSSGEEDSSTEETNNKVIDEPMEEGWTQVKSKSRKRR